MNKTHCSSILSSNKIIKFVDWVGLESYSFNKTFFSGKKDNGASWQKFFPWVLQIMYSEKDKWKRDFYSRYFLVFDIRMCMVSFIQICLVNIRTGKCTYMSLMVEWRETPIWEGDGYVFSCSLFNPVLFWNCSSNMGTQIFVSKKQFLSIYIPN